MSIKRRDAEMQSSFLIERRDAETQREIWTLRLCVQDLILLEISDEFIHSFDICIF